MAYLVLYYDRPAEGLAQGYNEKVKTWIRAGLERKGAVSVMAYRNVWPASPTNLTWIEFDSIESAEAAALHPVMKEMIAEMRAMGVTTVGVMLLEKSPFTPEPVRG